MSVPKHLKYIIGPRAQRYEINPETGCWDWLLTTKTKEGKGRLIIEGKFYVANRWIYEKFYGEIPKSMTVIMTCDNILCVNPDHAELIKRDDTKKCPKFCGCYKHLHGTTRSNALKVAYKKIPQEEKSRRGRERWKKLSNDKKKAIAEKVSVSHKTNPRIHHAHKANIKKDTRLEKYLDNFLTIFGIKFKKQVQIGRYCVDFLLENYQGNNIIIEAQGCYWHGCERCEKEGIVVLTSARQRDAKRKQILEKLGYMVVYLWGHEFPFYKDVKIIYDD